MNKVLIVLILLLMMSTSNVSAFNVSKGKSNEQSEKVDRETDIPMDQDTDDQEIDDTERKRWSKKKVNKRIEKLLINPVKEREKAEEEEEEIYEDRSPDKPKIVPEPKKNQHEIKHVLKYVISHELAHGAGHNSESGATNNVIDNGHFAMEKYSDSTQMRHQTKNKHLHKCGFIYKYLKVLKKYADGIGLSGEQKKKLEKMEIEVVKSCIGFTADIKIARIDLKQLLKEDNIDMHEARFAVKKVHDIEAKLETVHVEILNEAKSFLTPEQKIIHQKLYANVRKSKGKKSKRKKRKMKRKL